MTGGKKKEKITKKKLCGVYASKNNANSLTLVNLSKKARNKKYTLDKDDSYWHSTLEARTRVSAPHKKTPKKKKRITHSHIQIKGGKKRNK